MKILFIHDHLHAGGAAKAALRMRRVCHELGHETFSIHGDKYYDPKNPSLTLHGKGNRIQRLWEACLPPSRREKLRRMRAEKAFGALLRKQSFDFIWFQNIAGAKKWGWSEALVSKALRHAKVTITLHDMYYLGVGDSYVWERAIHPTRFAGMAGGEAKTLVQEERLSLNACSLWLSRLCNELYAMPCGQLPVPLWQEDFGPELQAPARIGVTRYLVAADHLQDKRKNIVPTLRFLLQHRILERTCSQILCLGRNLPAEFRVPQIVDLGHLENPSQYRSLYSQVDFLLHPSLMDNFPLVIQESLAQGRPVVALERGGVGEMIETGKTGYLYKESSGDSLEKIFLTLSRQAAPQYQAMSSMCRKYAFRNYSVSAVSARYQAFLASISGKRFLPSLY